MLKQVRLLGIESRSAAIADAPERDWKTLQSQQSDAERFKDAEPFHFRCRVCSTESDFTGLASTSVSSAIGSRNHACTDYESSI